MGINTPLFVAGGTLGKNQLIPIEINPKDQKLEYKFFIKIDDKTRLCQKLLNELIRADTPGDIYFWTATDEKKELTPSDNSFYGNTYLDGKVAIELEIPKHINRKIFITPEIKKDGDLVGNFLLNYFYHLERNFDLQMPNPLNGPSLLDLDLEKITEQARQKVPADMRGAYLLLGDLFFVTREGFDYQANNIRGKGDFVMTFINKNVLDATLARSNLLGTSFSSFDYKVHKMNFNGYKKNNTSGLYRFGNLTYLNPLNLDTELADFAKVFISNRHMDGDFSDKILKFGKIIYETAKTALSYGINKRPVLLCQTPIITLEYLRAAMTLGYHNTNAKTLGILAPDIDNIAQRISNGVGSKITFLLEEEKGFGMLYDIDAHSNVEFAKKYNHFKE